MTSPRQLDANRANATKSTGPRSDAGKARSRLNSSKHGLTAEKLVIFGEKAEDFEAFRGERFEELEPQSPMAAERVERIASIEWRLRRVSFFEAAIINARQTQVRKDAHEEQMLGLGALDRIKDEDEMGDDGTYGHELAEIGQALIKDCTSQDALGKLARHEATLMNALRKELQMLFLLEGKRAGKDEPMSLAATAIRST